MTIKELKASLEGLPDDMRVVVDDGKYYSNIQTQVFTLCGGAEERALSILLIL